MSARIAGAPGERSRIGWFGPGLVAAALGLQIFLPVAVPALALLNLPFLAMMCLALAYQSVIPAMFVGMAVGWLQDGLTDGPLGTHGLVYTLVGYSTGIASHYFKVHMPLVLGLLTGTAYLLHEVTLFLIRTYLLSLNPPFELGTWAALAVPHAAIALLAFPYLYRRFRIEWT